MTSSLFDDAQRRMLTRVATTRDTVENGLPHWASAETGQWTTTPDGDWTGGAYVGELWLAHLIDPSRFEVESAHEALAQMLPRLDFKTAFKGFGFYHGAAIGSILFRDEKAKAVAIRAAQSLAEMFDERLGLIPLGDDAEEASTVGSAESSIDSLQASPLLFWAARELHDDTLDQIATRHAQRVLEIHVRDDDSVVQSSTLSPDTGEVTRTHTHKGFSDTSTWGRAQGWAMLYSAHAAVAQPETPLWRDYARRTLNWWIAHVPDDLVAYWDFDDPGIPETSRDTAATTMAAAAALRLVHALEDGEERGHYQDFAERTTSSVIKSYLTPTGATDKRPEGILSGGCFTRKSSVRAHDAATNVELIFGSYFLLETLAVLSGALPAGRI